MGKVKFYKPRVWMMIVETIIILVTIAWVLRFFPLTTNTPFTKYSYPALVFLSAWLILSYFFNRYIPLRYQTYFKASFKLFYTIVAVFIIFAGFILIQKASPYSENVLFTITLGVFIACYVYLFIYFAFRYATQFEVYEIEKEQRNPVPPIQDVLVSKEVADDRKDKIVKKHNEKVYQYLAKNTNLNVRSTKVLDGFSLSSFAKTEPYTRNTYIQLKKLNNIRGINNMFATINEKLTDDGQLIVFYVSKSTSKQILYDKYPTAIAYIIYIWKFIIHRIAPKFFLTRRLYYDLTGGKKRVLSKTEVLGRLVFCGFRIEKVSKIEELNMVIAKRDKLPGNLKLKRLYGPLIKLKRCGKNGDLFNVYKMRTMHPYAEFLQQYIFEHNYLQEGGKFNKDIRVTSLGRFMRKYWLDELPMALNLLKGEMKLIGVRPLSKQYFNLYSKELQDKRIKFKPGLLPPFYADMPKTLDEIQASEMKYLTECEKFGVHKTDFKYFFLIIRNILFKKAHSA